MEGNSVVKNFSQESLSEGKRYFNKAESVNDDVSRCYACDHLRVPSVGMVEVPLTVVYSRNLGFNGQSPALLLGYGAYGEILSLNWCSDYLSLLDRGWVLAFAHVRSALCSW
jgi:protease II